MKDKKKRNKKEGRGGGVDIRDLFFADFTCERGTKNSLRDVISVSLYFLLIVNANSSLMIFAGALSWTVPFMSDIHA